MFNVVPKSNISSSFVSSAFPQPYGASEAPLLPDLFQLRLPCTDQISNLDRIFDVFVPLKFLPCELLHFSSVGGTLGDFICRPHDISPQGYYTLAEEEIG